MSLLYSYSLGQGLQGIKITAKYFVSHSPIHNESDTHHSDMMNSCKLSELAAESIALHAIARLSMYHHN